MSNASKRRKLLALLQATGEPRTVVQLVREHEGLLVVGEGEAAFSSALTRVGTLLVGLRREGKVKRARVSGRTFWTALEDEQAGNEA